jgi:hypothetical protein
MDRCRECNSSVAPGETACVSCGSIVRPKDTGPGIASRLVLISKIAFILSAIMTVASLIFSATPPFWKCAVATVVMQFVKSSAEQMVEKKKG